MSVLEDRVDTVTCAIKSLHNRKLAIDYLSNDQMVKLYNSTKETATTDGFTLLPKQVSDLFQIKTFYLSQNNDIAIILHLPCINVQELMKIYRHLSFPIILPQAINNHGMTIRQSIENEQHSKSDFAEIFDQSDLSFPSDHEALFITDKHELIAIGKDNTFKVISQVELASCVQRNHVYMCDRYQVLGNDLANTCLGALYIRSEPGMQKHCRFKRKLAQ
jgi:hypothetical protein